MTRELAHVRVLVTGGTGFIGSHLVRRLVREEACVHVLARPGRPPGRIADLGGRVTLWAADLADRPAVRACVAGSRPQVVFHLAGDSAGRHFDGWERLDQSVDANLGNVLNLLQAIHDAGGSPPVVVRVGGLEEYGQGPVPYDEDQRESPVSPYSASQVAATHFCQMLGRSLGLPIVTLRLALTYGPSQAPSFLIPALIHHCLEGRGFAMTAGDQRRDYVFVGDAVEALLRAAVTPEAGGQIINVGSGVESRVLDVAQAVVRLAGAIDLHVGAVAARRTEIQHLVCNPAKAERLLDWTATTSLEDGLARTVAWYREHSAGFAREAICS
ncbi:MAG: NAD-dependent epimerase/dehydratase family protein [Gemmataceae bacterium]